MGRQNRVRVRVKCRAFIFAALLTVEYVICVVCHLNETPCYRSVVNHPLALSTL
jgi:hypothetical protein